MDGSGLLQFQHLHRGHYEEALAMRHRAMFRLIILSSFIFVFNGINGLDAAFIGSGNTRPAQKLKAQWGQQRSLRNQRLLQKQIRAQRFQTRAGLGAASLTQAQSLSYDPTSLMDVWNSFSGSMRFANQLQPDSYTGLLPDTPFVQMLQSRRAINQARFDSNHGLIAQLMDWNDYFKNQVSPTINPGTDNKGPTVPQVIVPEPSGFVLGLGMIAVISAVTAKKRRNQTIASS